MAETGGTQCAECMEVIVEGDPSIECESCGADAIEEVTIADCPLANADACKADEHHWGIGKHVTRGSDDRRYLRL